MGKTTIPAYRIEASFVNFSLKKRDVQSFAWESSYGKPTVENAAKFRSLFNKSLIDGPNKHLSGQMSGLGTVRIIHQKTGSVVAEFVPPLFEII